MPLEQRFRKPIQAMWNDRIVERGRRLVYFKDESEGRVSTWHWDFGDGTSSTEQNPIHQYQDTKPGSPAPTRWSLR